MVWTKIADDPCVTRRAGRCAEREMVRVRRVMRVLEAELGRLEEAGAGIKPGITLTIIAKPGTEEAA